MRQDAELLWKDVTYGVDEVFQEVLIYRGNAFNVESVPARQLLQEAGDGCPVIRKHIKKRSTVCTEEDFFTCLESGLKDSVGALGNDFCYFPSFQSALELAGPREFPPCFNVTS